MLQFFKDKYFQFKKKGEKILTFVFTVLIYLLGVSLGAVLFKFKKIISPQQTTGWIARDKSVLGSPEKMY